MTPGPLMLAAGHLNRLQRSFWFKAVASALVLALAITAVTVYAVRLSTLQQDNQLRLIEAAPDARPDAADPAAGLAAEREKAVMQAERTAAEATTRALNRMLAARFDPTVIVVGVGAVAALLLAVVWLGIGLTSLAILTVLGALAVPLMYLGGPAWADVGRFIAGVGCLGFAFVVLMELLRLALSGPNAVLAIARNVVSEAVRIRISVVFIVILLLGLAALPALLDPATPLRYRVQSFLQYGTAGTFWIIALLVLFLSVSTVAFEQRDRVIWQTMTKPVSPRQYLFGKWLGVVGIAAVLLAVSSTGVFLFTEYLRDQRAVGEAAPYRPEDPGEAIVEDRLVLESQVLTARRSLRPGLPVLNQDQLELEVLNRYRKAHAAAGNTRVPDAVPDADRAAILTEFTAERRTQHFTIEGGRQEEYVFSGLGAAKGRDSPITLRYKVDVGANDPKGLHKITISMENQIPVVQEVPLGQTMTLPISPASIRPDGTLVLRIVNGDFNLWQAGEADWAGRDSMSFPPGGFEVFYSVGSYHANFLRAVLVLWLKLAFLAMVAILAATFLSFAVASLVAFGTFLIAESSGFLANALEYYASTDDKGGLMIGRMLIRGIAVPISRSFQFYAQLRPTTNLVDGLVIGWDKILLTVGVVGAVTAILYLCAVTIFRRRELAMYSGQ